MESRCVLRRIVSFTLLYSLIIHTASQELPPFDPVPSIKDGEAVYTLPLVVQSEMLGLAVEIVLGIKILLSEALGTASESLHYVNADVVDASASVYFVEYEIVTSMEELEISESVAKTYISSGGLAEGFANLGISGMHFLFGKPQTTSGTIAPAPVETQPSPNPSPTDAPVQRKPDTEDTIATLLDIEPGLLPGEEASRLVHFHIRSPVLFFHPDLKLAITWFAGDRTGSLTEPPSWFMTDVTVLNTTFGQYIASFVHIGNVNTTETSVREVEALVGEGELDTFMKENDARNVSVSLLPVLDNVKPEDAIAPQDGFSTVVLLVRISAPITGVTPEVNEIIKSSGASVTNTRAQDWRVKAMQSELEGATNGPFWLDYEVRIKDNHDTMLATVANMTLFLRTRALDHTFWERGITDIRMTPRKRLTRFRTYSDGSAIQSSATTAAASIAGMVIVIIVGGCILFLLPRGDDFRIHDENAKWKGRE